MKTDQMKQIKKQAEKVYMEMSKRRSVADLDNLQDAMVSLLQTPEIVEKYDNNVEKALKALTKQAKWRNEKQAQRLRRHELFIADNEGNAIDQADYKPIVDTERLEMIEHILNLIGDDEKNRMIFRSYYVYGRTLQEIADKTDLNINTVYKRLMKVVKIIEDSNIRRLYAESYLTLTESPASTVKAHPDQSYPESVTKSGDLTPISKKRRTRQIEKEVIKANAIQAKKAAYVNGIEHDIKLLTKDPEPVIGAQTMANWYANCRCDVVNIYDDNDLIIGQKPTKTYQDADPMEMSFR